MNRPILSRVFRAYPLEFAALGLLAAGVLAWGLVADPARAFSGLLTAALFALTISLGGAIFIAVQGVSGARWWAPVRGVASAVAGTYAVPALALAGTLALGLPFLYEWARPSAALAPALVAKAAWLNRPMFLARAVVILLGWAGLVALLRTRAAALESGVPAATRRFARASVAFLLVLAPTLSVASWDWVMSLEPRWTSTMYSVYLFSGAFLTGIAAVTAAALLLDAKGLLPEPLSAAARHDLGKLLFAFSMFWAYIWFCQYLLIWYSNLPEETPYYALRSHGGWSALFWLTPVLSFGAPFAALLSGAAKRHPALLGQVAVVVLLGRWLDLHVMIAPVGGPVPAFPSYAVSATALLLAGVAFAFDRALLGQASTEAATEIEALPAESGAAG